MKHFLRIAQGVDTMPLLHELHRRPHLWNANRFRTTYPNTPHSAVDDIWLRFSDSAKCDTTANVIGDNNPVWHAAANELPWQPIVLDLMRRVNAYALDRCLITRLPPGGRILPHADNQGSYVHDAERERYHIVIQGLQGSLYRTGDETVCMRTGEVWLFDALTEHEVMNGSEDDRIHLLADLRLMP